MITVEYARLYARLSKFKNLVSATESKIAGWLKSVSRPYIACSFGKDSLVMTHLVWKQKPDIAVRFLKWRGESDLLYDFEPVIAECLSKYSLNLETIEMERESLADKTTDRWQSLQKDSDAYFVGLRSQESKDRRLTLRQHGEFYKKADGLIRLCPIGKWMTEDIAAYIVSCDLPMLDAYRTEGFESRTSARIPRKSVRDAAMSALKHRNMESYNLLRQKFLDL